MAELLSLDSITVTFGGLMAVSGVSFDVREGEVFGIIGPNGAGKSTLFNAISGLIRPASGSIAFQGKDITRTSPQQRMRLGFQRTFQSVQLVKTFTVLENILLGMHHDIAPFPGPGQADAITHAREIAGLLGIETVSDRVMDTLSFREQRFTEIARAVATRPRVLLLDEPAAGLSEAEIEDLKSLVRRLRNQSGITVLLVEHVMPLVMSLCDRIAVLETGMLIALAPPAQVAADPRVIAAYLGTGHA